MRNLNPLSSNSKTQGVVILFCVSEIMFVLLCHLSVCSSGEASVNSEIGNCYNKWFISHHFISRGFKIGGYLHGWGKGVLT